MREVLGLLMQRGVVGRAGRPQVEGGSLARIGGDRDRLIEVRDRLIEAAEGCGPLGRAGQREPRLDGDRVRLGTLG